MASVNTVGVMVAVPIGVHKMTAGMVREVVGSYVTFFITISISSQLVRGIFQITLM
jgi:hypothetical protein